MRDFSMTKREAMRLPLGQAFALRAWSMEANPMVSVERSTPGYIAQEIKRRMAE